MLSRKSLVVLILALALVLPAATQVSAITHLEVGTGNLITLVYQNGAEGLGFYRVKATGVVETKIFKPSNTLIIMDIDCTFKDGNPGQLFNLSLRILKNDNPQVFQTNVAADGSGKGSLNVHLTSALTFGSGSTVQVDFPDSGNFTIETLYLHGYVA